MAIDHIALNVENVDRALSFYHDALGLEVERLEEFRAGKVGFPSVRVTTQTVIDLMPGSAVDRGGRHPLNHFALTLASDDLDSLRNRLLQHDVEIVEEEKPRWGAQGNEPSMKVLDPDGNIVELKAPPAVKRAGSANTRKYDISMATRGQSDTGRTRGRVVTEDVTFIDRMPHGSWRADSVVVGRIKLDNPQLTVTPNGDMGILELTGECAPGDLAVETRYPVKIEANHMRWQFEGMLKGHPTAGAMRRGQFWHHVAIEPAGQVLLQRIRS